MSWFILAPLSIMMSLIGILLSPVLALFAVSTGYLPRWLSWFQPPDSPAIGDEAYHANQMSWTKSRYLWALFWLCRNPAYGFDALVGAEIKEGFKYISKGDELTGNTPLHNGWVWRSVDGYWQLYIVYAWSATKCWKINLGWKLWGTLVVGDVRRIVLTITPFAKFS